MSANGTVRIVWPNGEDEFCLAKIGQLLDVEEKCGAGIAEVAGRLESGVLASEVGSLGGRWRFNDVYEVIRNGLIGGGKTAREAHDICARHVVGQPLLPNVLVAYRIVSAVIVGVPGDDVGKKPEAGTESPSTMRTAVSADPLSSGSGPASDSPPASASAAPSGNSPPASMGSTGRTAESGIPNL